MKANVLFKAVIVVLMVLSIPVLSGCGSNPFPGGEAAMTVRLVDAPITGYKEVNLNIQRVEILPGDESAPIVLGTPNKTVNLLTLTNGVSETLASDATIPAGQYTQMRLVLGEGNTVKLADDSVHDLKVPSGLQSGVKLVVNFTVEAGTTKDIVIDFEAANSIHLNKTGQSKKYILRPVIHAYDKVLTGSISGTMTDASNGQALAGAIVTAQTVDSNGVPTAVRSTTTAADGSYMLDLLNVGGTYYVVSQPVVGAVAYEAKASDAMAITSESPTKTYSAAFTAVSTVGEVKGSITPVLAENQSDTVYLMQNIASKVFIVRSATATIVDAGESYAFSGVPVGGYSVKAVRTTTAEDGTVAKQDSLTAPAVTVTDGVSATADLQF